MGSKTQVYLSLLAGGMLSAGPGSLCAADGASQWVHVALPADAPVSYVDVSLGQSNARLAGLSMVFDIHAQLMLRNVGSKPVHGMTLRVEAQDVSPGGLGSVTEPSLNILPGEVFPVRIDVEVVRPFIMNKNGTPVVEIKLDGVLFSDLQFYGQDKLGSRRALLVYELQARRDREYFSKLIETGQRATLRQELDFGLPDMSPRQLGLELLRDLTPFSYGVEQPLQMSFTGFPGAPVRAISGTAHVQGNELRHPHVELRNTTNKNVRTIDLGWILRDERGHDHMAGSLPADVALGPVQTAHMAPNGVLRFSEPGGRPMQIESVSAFVNTVEFGDGRMWIPSRADIAAVPLDPGLKRAIGSSPEQQRLRDIYRRKGETGLAAELKKFN
jgi:hypothetical protein